MIKRQKTPKPDDEKPTSFRPQLGDEVEGMLADFCAAHHEANMSAVVRRAVERFIRADVAKNEGVNDVFEALQRERSKRKSPASTDG